MWNKPEPGEEAVRSDDSSDSSSSSVGGGQATIGPSISICGTLVGGEDLLVEGKLEGEISVEQHSVTVGKRGKVKADIYGKGIYVEGEVKGNLFGKEQVVIKQSGRVTGNVTSPRVSLENGSHFRGNIDMQPVTQKPSSAGSTANDSGSKKNEKTGAKTGRGGAQADRQLARSGAA